MKKMYIHLIPPAVLAVFLLSACTGMNDIHQKYLDRGETVYAAMPDTAWSAAGNKRVEIFMKYHSHNIAGTRIYWNDFADSTDVAIGGTGLFSKLLADLGEGETLIYLMSIDRDGNTSLKYEVVATIYGDIYAQGLVNRSIKSIEFDDEDAMVITWRDPAEGTVETVLTYKDSSGKDITLIIPAEENITILEDFLPESPYTYFTRYLPEEGAIDAFVTEPIEDVFPPDI